jgi:hypothetical protein
MTLFEFIRELFANAALQQDFAEDPQGVLQVHGLDGITASDVREALLRASDGPTGWPPPAAHESAVHYLTTYTCTVVAGRAMA